ncbi:hypothetical protein EMCRGX_G019096 [Ephydatia muelleri]
MFGKPLGVTTTSTLEYARALEQRLVAAYEHVREYLGIEQRRHKQLYDRKVEGKPYKEGDSVWLYCPAVPQGHSKKLHACWKGPYTVAKVYEKGVYQIKWNLPPHKQQVVHFDRLKPYLTRHLDDEPMPDESGREEHSLDETTENEALIQDSIMFVSILIYSKAAHVTGVVVLAINTTSVRVSWLAVQLPPDGILTGYTVYYLSLPNTSKRQSGGYTSHTFPPTTTSGDINNLNPNGVYQFSVVAQVTIMGQLYSGEMDTSLVNTPTTTPVMSSSLRKQQMFHLKIVMWSYHWNFGPGDQLFWSPGTTFFKEMVPTRNFGLPSHTIFYDLH